MRDRRIPLRALCFLFVLAVCVSTAVLLGGRGPLDAGATRVAASATPVPISKAALDQIAALNREKESRTPAQRKIDSRLLYTIRAATGSFAAEGVPKLETGLAPDAQGRIEVDIRADVTPELLRGLESAGAKVIYSSAKLKTVIAVMPAGAIEPLAELGSVRFISPKEENGPAAQPSETPSLLPAPAEKPAIGSVLPSAKSTTRLTPGVVQGGSAISEGDLAHAAALARALSGSDGTGVKIGVLSDGVSSLAARQASGDLPGNVTVVVPGPAGTEEGTAMLEIVHDIAPGAQLFFATATGSGSAAFADNIRTLRNVHGCDIIVDDWTYYAETPFQDGQASGVVSNTNGGVVVQAVNEVTASGALFFSSAGNSGNKNDGTSGAWEGDFVSGGPSASPLPAGLEVHDFGGGSLFNTVSAQASVNAGTYLKWSDPLGGSANDYDFYSVSSDGTTILSAGTNIQNGAQDPQEVVARPPTGSRLVVVRKAGAAGRFLHINTNRGRLSISTSGVVHGHNGGRNTQTTAATPARGPFPRRFSGTDKVELFSSDGPRRIFFNADGSQITPGNVSSTGGELLAKPDITAADGVTTTTPGFLTFFGTSAAAPHAAAIAALLKSETPGLTASQIAAAMKDSAVDIEQPGPDRDSGAGIVMPIRAMSAVGVEGPAYLELRAISTSQVNGNGNGTVDAGETWNLTAGLENLGLQNATAVSATLSAVTPGVTVVPSATRGYADMQAVSGFAENFLPFTFSLPGNFPCGAPVQFSLSVTYAGAPAPRVINFAVSSGSTTTINTILDADAPPAGEGYTALTNNNQVSRLNRNGQISSCASPKAAAPPLQDNTPGRRFDQYTFTASAAGCVTVTIAPGNATALYSAAYNGSYDPANIRTNYIADYGVTTPGTFQYSFNVAAGQQYVVVVHEVNAGGGAGVGYTLNVEGPRSSGCLAPFAVPGAISGRTVDAEGRGVYPARVVVTDGVSVTRIVPTNTFGFFRVEGLPPGSYTVTPGAKRYNFASVPLNVSGNLSEVLLVGTR